MLTLSGKLAPMNSVVRRDLYIIAVARALSFVGDQIALITLMLRVAAHGPRIMTALITLCAALPAVVLSPYAGGLIDRIPVKKFIGGLGLVNAVAAVGIGVWHGPVATLLLMVVLGASAAFTGPGYSALVPSFVPADDLPTANGTLQTFTAMASMAGPFLGGILVAAFGTSWPLYIDALSFAILAIGTLSLRHDRIPAADAHLPEQRDVWAGVKLLWNDALLRAVIIVIIFFVLALMMVNVTEVFFITQTLHASTLMYGISGGIFGVGMLVGSIIGGQLKGDQRRQILYIFGGAFTISLCFTGIALAPSLAWIFAPLAIAGIGNGITETVFPTLFALRSDEAIRGRVFAAVGVIFTVASMVSIAFGGLVTSLLSPRGVFLLGGASSAVVIVILAPYALRHAKKSD